MVTVRIASLQVTPERLKAMIGKVDPESLAAHVLCQTGATDADVLCGPAYGEDAAAIEFPGGTLVVSTDPISLATERVGTLGVHVAANDVAASGADPRWLTCAIFLPDDDPVTIETVTEQLDSAADSAGVAIVGGHTEYNSDLARPLLSLTCLGPAARFVPTGGAEPGDRVLLTKGAGIEGTAILASDFRDALSEAGVSGETLERAESFYEEISVIAESRAVREHATAMHDPTEGGLTDGLVELASASGTEVAVERETVPIREETRACCTAMDVDPLRIFGSGALLATVPEVQCDAAIGAIEAEGIEVVEIGEVRATDEPKLVLDDEPIVEAVRDALYSLWEDA